jgi:hypothetical protein
VSGALVGAVIGLVVGVSLSFSVARADARKRKAGARKGREYTSSLVVVPLLFAVVGGLVGGAIAH